MNVRKDETTVHLQRIELLPELGVWTRVWQCQRVKFLHKMGETINNSTSRTETLHKSGSKGRWKVKGER